MSKRRRVDWTEARSERAEGLSEHQRVVVVVGTADRALLNQHRVGAHSEHHGAVVRGEVGGHAGVPVGHYGHRLVAKSDHVHVDVVASMPQPVGIHDFDRRADQPVTGAEAGDRCRAVTIDSEPSRNR